MFSEQSRDHRGITDVDAFQRPVVFFANGLGDTLLALPALRALTVLFPHRLALVCDQGVHPSLLTELALRQVVEARMTRNVPDWTREFPASGVAAQIGDCDLFISLVPWLSRSLQQLARELKPHASVGFFEDYMIRVPLDFAQHAADLTFSIAQALQSSLRVEDYAEPPVLDLQHRRMAEQIRSAVPRSFRMLVVHADTGRPKMWPAERFERTLDLFLDRHPEFLVMLVGATPQPLDSGRNSKHVIPCYGLPLGGAVALTGLADLFLGVDSCMLHAADLFRVPGVGLFGASSSVEYGFRFTPSSIVLEAGSMESIAVPAVVDALEQLAGNA